MKSVVWPNCAVQLFVMADSNLLNKIFVYLPSNGNSNKLTQVYKDIDYNNFSWVVLSKTFIIPSVLPSAPTFEHSSDTLVSLGSCFRLQDASSTVKRLWKWITLQEKFSRMVFMYFICHNQKLTICALKTKIDSTWDQRWYQDQIVIKNHKSKYIPTRQ